MHAEDNDVSEAKAPEEEELPELSSKASSQVERRVVSVLAPHKPEDQRFSKISSGSFSSLFFFFYRIS